jgi:hypothetical protein
MSDKKMIKRADGSKSQRGLWDNIAAKRKRGEPKAKPGSEDYPDKKAFEKAQGKKRFGKLFKKDK